MVSSVSKVARVSSKRRLQIFPALGLLFLILGSCSSDLEEFGYNLRIYSSALPTAFQKEFYRTQIHTTGGLRPFNFELAIGSLPEGISLKSGWLIGAPTMLGTYSFTVVVSDGKLSRTFQDFELTVAKPPPPEITLNVPLTDIHQDVIIRAQVRKARLLQSSRTWVRWDPTLFDLVEDSPSPHSSTYALLFETQPGILKIDLAVLGASISGDHRLFNFVLRPRGAGPLQLSHATEYFSGLENHSFSLKSEGQIINGIQFEFPTDFLFPASVPGGTEN